jgi:hypothetical protein
MEDEATSWMAEVKGQKAEAKSQSRQARVKESRIRGVGWRREDKVYDGSKEDAEAGASGTALPAAVGYRGQPGDGRFWRIPGGAIGDSRRAGGRISGSRKAQKN